MTAQLTQAQPQLTQAQPRPSNDRPLAAAPLSKPASPAHIIGSDAEAIETAHRLAEKFVNGSIERDRERILPIREVEEYSQSGLWSINIPKQYGGAGVSYATVAEVIKIVTAADASIGQIPQNHISILDLVRFHPDEASQRLLYEASLRGLRFGNALVEFGTSNVREYKTTLTRRGDDYVLNGQKFYATGALFAHLIPVAVLLDGKGVLAFAERDAPGLSVIDDWSGFGQRTTASGTVILDNVPVKASHVLPTYPAYERPSVHGPVSQLTQAAIDAGIAVAALDDTIAFVRKHTRSWIDSGKQHGYEDPFTIFQIGDIAARVHAAEAVLAEAGHIIDEALADENEDSVARASIAVAEAKILTTDASLLASSKLFELAGSRATLAEHGLDRHWRNARTHTLHDPVRWKYFAIGNFHLNGTRPPRHVYI